MDDNKLDIRNNKHMQVVRERVKGHEGYELIPYNLKYKGNMDKAVTEGFLTGGFGHKMLPGEVAPVDKAGWNLVFESDFKKAMDGAYRIMDGSDMQPEAFGVLTAMVFQMGETNISGWSKTIKALKEGNYKEAGLEVLRGNSEGTVSKWSLQTPDRAVEASNLLISLGNKE
jgi:GH24 family phage-related lysozyme (muramidase)|tara:strand:- start:180 stop:692 length:513 start_codon:yes stop_codon:yes gene_type:complete